MIFSRFFRSSAALKDAVQIKGTANVRLFNNSAILTSATILDGKFLSRKIQNSVAEEVEQLKRKDENYHPSLVIVQVGKREDSNVYVRMKEKAAKKVGITYKHYAFPDTISQSTLLREVRKLNDDLSVHGILVQLPLPRHLNEKSITESILAEKDVDGFGAVNIGMLAKNTSTPIHVPCTPMGVMELLHHHNIPIAGKNAVILGRSDIVGNPVSYLLRQENATVTVCHSHTKNLPEQIAKADILVAALGKPEFVRGEWVKPGAVVVDVGINAIQRSGKRELVGDVHYPSVSQVAGHITPVPGGVGPMTVAMLMRNTVRAAELSRNKSILRKVSINEVTLKEPVPSDIEIAKSQELKKITTVAEEMGIHETEIETYGHYKAKVDLKLYERLKHRKDGNYIVVSGITPTPFGEGKSTVVAGLVQALGHLGKLGIACVRQPSQGPTFGVKGGAAGGGYAQFVPMDDFNLHMTGDIHAVTAANNLLVAALETRMFHESTQSDAALIKRMLPFKNGHRVIPKGLLPRWKRICDILKHDPTEIDNASQDVLKKFVRLNIDLETIACNRVLDVNDRFLRTIEGGLAPTEKGRSRKTSFDISVASECMSILALSNDLKDMRHRLTNMVIANDKNGNPITAGDLGVAGAMAVLLKDAIKPNLMQTLEGTPALVHAGPFANISIGASSTIADKIALKLAGTESFENADKAGYVVTEAGFASDMGMEKFFNIKCRSSGLKPSAVVLVTTVKALKLHGGGQKLKPGTPLPDEYLLENLDLVSKGCANMVKHIQNSQKFNVPVVVAINSFKTDTAKEYQIIREHAVNAGAIDAIPSFQFSKGGQGAISLAETVMKACSTSQKSDFKFLYDSNASIEDKITTIAKEMYGAKGIEFSLLAEKRMKDYKRQGYEHLPICMAKTQYSLSHDPKLLNVPKEFTVPIRDMRLNAGAGFIYPLTAKIQTIPGLPTAPAYLNIDLTDDGEILGLS
ncbi:C-1-tetrahydrofolate synthase [Schizosaccharomyces cryophilus OY26]|uniref:C-1-tetrahydrofolate synthase n=1 Tax=Schizosaccharomyces cryophilus (strain OY26 / ATCC MYA-4695 / CBS 11777 / NBRC 106824 / NRRL Y48691) TaxID=653667 RepID=S9VRB0_SCHCR|nr:C-1-tetrahydrofolate synthase [Schizosaccharomyces cryophilus OY26]EPY50483.1 C-1-tetrahydrofolate synthase [Schizosaccharomyces cryophilus OY26]